MAVWAARTLVRWRIIQYVKSIVQNLYFPRYLAGYGPGTPLNPRISMGGHTVNITLSYHVRSQISLGVHRNVDRIFQGMTVEAGCSLFEISPICGVSVVSTLNITGPYAIRRTRCKVFRLYVV
jgi:hypothetical protein